MVGQLEVGIAVTNLSLDEPSRESMRDALADRARRAGTAYDIVLENKAVGTIVRGSIAAVPEYNADGEISGSVGFVRDETIEFAATAIYREMEQAKVSELLLAGLTRELRLVLKFDALLVTLIGQDGKHLRLFYDSDPANSASTFRWWPMPSYVKKLLNDFQPHLAFEAFYESEAKHNPDIAHFWKRGFRYPCQSTAA